MADGITPRCCALVTPSNTGLRFPRPVQCSNRGRFERLEQDGSFRCYCKIHDPEVEARKDAARRKKWDDEATARRVKHERQRQEALACRGVTDPVATMAAVKYALRLITLAHMETEHGRAVLVDSSRRALQMLGGQP